MGTGWTLILYRATVLWNVRIAHRVKVLQRIIMKQMHLEMVLDSQVLDAKLGSVVWCGIEFYLNTI